MLFMEIIAVDCENHTEHINTMCGQYAEFLIAEEGGTYRYHYALKQGYTNPSSVVTWETIFGIVVPNTFS